MWQTQQVKGIKPASSYGVDAYQRDWPIILASECVDSYDREHHHMTLKYVKEKLATLMTNHEIDAMLDAPA